MTPTLVAELDARFDGRGHARVRSTGPLELRGPLSASRLYYLRNVTAGIFGGDAYRTSIDCAAGGSARIESSSATKVYSMPAASATSRTSLHAEPGASIIWGPHATILQAGSALRQETRVSLHDGARVLIAETLIMGRIASGQRFDFTSYDSQVAVEDACAQCLYREAYRFEPGEDLVAAMNGLGVLTTVFGLGVNPETASEALDALLSERTLAGWSRLPNRCGLVVKALGASLSEGTALAREALVALEESSQR